MDFANPECMETTKTAAHSQKSKDIFRENPELLVAFRAGDSKALTEVYRYYERPLRHFVLRGFSFKSGSRDLYFRGAWSEADLDDVVQETFRRAFGERARQSFDGVRPYKNYLFTIARNAVINDLSAKNRQIPVGDAIFSDAYNENMTPLEAWVRANSLVIEQDSNTESDVEIENLEIYSLVIAFAESLASDTQAFFNYRFLAHLSQEKTAKKLGWNRARVRKLETKLRTQIVYFLRETGYLEYRDEFQKIHRKSEMPDTEALFAKARIMYRTRTLEENNEILQDAA